MRTILESALEPPPHISDVEPRSERDDALFADLATVLAKYGALDRFGVTLLHRHFPIAPGECLLETTDVPSRTQTIQPMRTADLPGEFVETSWRLGRDFVAMACQCKLYGDDHQHQHKR